MFRGAVWVGRRRRRSSPPGTERTGKQIIEGKKEFLEQDAAQRGLQLQI